MAMADTHTRTLHMYKFRVGQRINCYNDKAHVLKEKKYLGE